MLDGVLDERLQEEPRQEDRARVLRDVPLEVERPGVASLQYRGVLLEPRDLLLERLQLVVVERVAQQIAEACDEAAGLARVVGHEPGDGVERVEQEVRLEVRP